MFLVFFYTSLKKCFVFKGLVIMIEIYSIILIIAYSFCNVNAYIFKLDYLVTLINISVVNFRLFRVASTAMRNPKTVE